MNHHTFTVLTNLVGIIDQELMPNVGRIAVQDYQRLNETLILARNLLNEPCALETSSDIYKEFAVAMVPSTPARLGERIHEIIAEWLKGCSCASTEHPEDCPACTRGAMDSIAKALDTRKVSMSPLLAAPYGQPWENFSKLVDLHTDKLHENEYTYFELAYTRTTGWMAWLCSKPSSEDPNRVVHACGQAETAETACYNALQDYNQRQAGKAKE